MFGKKMKKINTQRNKRERRLMINGKRNLSFIFLGQVMWKMKLKLARPKKTGRKEGNQDMVGESQMMREPVQSQGLEALVEICDLRTIKQRPLRRNSNQN